MHIFVLYLPSVVRMESNGREVRDVSLSYPISAVSAMHLHGAEERKKKMGLNLDSEVTGIGREQQLLLLASSI